ncbi:MAG: TM1812 family CRISPR-associated protein [Thermoplasmatota archaeon]
MTESQDVTFITFVGRSEWAVVNSFTAILFHTDLKPGKIHLLYKSSDNEIAESCVEGLNGILDVKGIACDIIEHELKDEFDLMKPAEIMEDILDEDEEVVIDITPARKFMSSSALIEGMRNDVKGIYYLYIDSIEDADRPYFDIPLPRQDLIEMTRGEHLVRD